MKSFSIYENQTRNSLLIIKSRDTSNGKIGHFLASLFADSIPFPYDIPCVWTEYFLLIDLVRLQNTDYRYRKQNGVVFRRLVSDKIQFIHIYFVYGAVHQPRQVIIASIIIDYNLKVLTLHSYDDWNFQRMAS